MRILLFFNYQKRWKCLMFMSCVLLALSSLLFLLSCNVPFDRDLAAPDQLYKSRIPQPNHGSSDVKKLKAALIILIISGHSNFHIRDVIRETWLRDVNDANVIAKFVIGLASLDEVTKQKIVSEELNHNDLILLENVEDSYQVLTNKVLQAFIWIDEKVDFKFVLKVDDDSYVRVASIMKELDSKPEKKLYWGFFDGRANVKISGKWKETDWFLCDKYLPYARGGGYVLSSDLVFFIAANSPLLQHYLSEDVSVGTWLAALKIVRVHDQHFDTEYISRGCLNNYLITHKQSVSLMQELHNNLQTSGQLCGQEYITRGSYEYNWSYPPSKCCERAGLKRHEEKMSEF